MKVLVDAGVPRSAAELLRRGGIDAIHVADVGMAEASDVAILAWASSDDRVVVTLASDFHRVLAQQSARRPSVLRFRVEGLKAVALATLVQSAFDQAGDLLAAGAVATYHAGRFRIRRLPMS